MDLTEILSGLTPPYLNIAVFILLPVNRLISIVQNGRRIQIKATKENDATERNHVIFSHEN